MNIDELKQHKFIVICYEHYTPLGIVRSLGEVGIEPVLIVIKGNARIVSLSKYLSKIHYVKNVEEQYKVLLEEYGNEDNKPFVYPCDDRITSYIDSHFDEVKDKFYVSNANNTADRISFFQNKKNICDIATKYGLNIAKTYVVKRGEIPEKITYPVITKTISSNSGAWKNDYFICYSENELKEAYKKIKSEDLLLQQFIKKKTELALDGVSINNGSEYITIASRYTYSIPGNYSCEMEITNYSSINHYESIKKSLDAIFKEIGYDGIFEVEFMIDENEELYFLEINFRSSTWNYAATKLGMNLPLMWANGQLYKNFENDAEKIVPSGFKAMAELPDFALRVLKKNMTLWSWIKNLKTVDCFYYYNKNDVKPFWGALKDKIEHQLCKVMNKK